MSDHAMITASDAESTTSFDLAPDSPLTKEKTRAAHAKWILELEQRPEFTLVSTVSQDPSLTIEAAIHQLVALTHDSALDDSTGSHCWTTACSFLETASRTAPEQQGKLIAFLLALRNVTLMHPGTNEPWAFEDGEGAVWQDLPTFGYTIADEMGSFDGYELAYTPEEARKWENLTAFLAQIDASIGLSPSVLDCSMSWALTAFAWAFEGSGGGGGGGGDGQCGASELAVRLACIWLVYDSEKLWARVGDEQAEANTRERWEAWRQGLVESQRRWGSGTTPVLIQQALAHIQRVQNSN